MPSESAGRRFSHDGIPDPLVRAQLDRILASEMFCRSERLSSFLRFVVEQTLSGLGDSIKEQVLATEVYGKPDFNAGEDATVRNDARRLRDKLREYYVAFPRDPMIIALPKGTYTPVFERNVAFPSSDILHEPQPSPGVNRKWGWPAMLAAAAGVAAVAITLWYWSRTTSPRADAWRAVPISSLPGFEGSPSLSPDGKFVAFTWTGSQKPGQLDIYIKAVDSEALRRLTDTPESETYPAWSPDGSDIAFVRPGQGVFLISQLGGPERKVSSVGTHVGWAPDGRSVLIRARVDDRPFSIFQIQLNTLERRQLTQPTSGSGDRGFAVSPDGKTLAFTRFQRNGVGDLYIVPMSGGEIQRRTNWNSFVQNAVWTPDGRDLILNAGYGFPLSLWRIPAHGRQPERGSPVLLPINANSPSISRPAEGQPARLAFLKVDADISLRLIDLDAPRSGDGNLVAQPQFDSTAVEYPGGFSHDATRIAFTSERTGGPQLWVGRRGTTGLRQITKLDSPEVRAPSWSPDGSAILFEATIDGNTDIFAIDPEGGNARRLTSETSIDRSPSWSPDGRTVYFSSDRMGRTEVWKARADGGAASQLTTDGGFEPIASLDGKSVYYMHRADPGSAAPAPARLKQIPIEGGEARIVLESVLPAHWAVTERGIFFLTKERDWDAIDLYQTATGKSVRIGRLPFRVTDIGDLGRFTVSRDGRWALTLQTDRWEADIQLVENFR